MPFTKNLCRSQNKFADIRNKITGASCSKLSRYCAVIIAEENGIAYISSMKSKTATIFVSGNECLFLSTSFFLALLHDGSVPIIVGTMNNYVHFLFEIKTQPGVLLRPKR